MNRIDFTAAAQTGGTQAKNGREDGAEPGLDEGFRKLLSKLSGEPRHTRKGADVSHDDAPRFPGKRAVKTHIDRTPDSEGPRTPARTAEDADSADEEENATPEAKPVPEAAQAPDLTDIAQTRAGDLPPVLQAMAAPAEAKAANAPGAGATRDGTGHGAAIRPEHPAGSSSAAPGAADMPADGKRDPFAALTSLLAKDDFGTEPEITPPEKPIEAPKLSIVSRETHFEPVVQVPPMQQVADAIAGQIGGLDETQPGRPTADLDHQSLRTQSDGPLRILHLKLEPNSLGEVSIKMRLVGDSIELRVEASRAETAQLLQKDSELLHRILRSSGYTPDIVSIQHATPETTSSLGNQAQQNHQGQSAPNGFAASQGGAQSQGQRPGGGQAQPSHDGFQQNEITTNDPAPARASDRDLYL